MPDTTLIRGPYRAPRCRIGKPLFDLSRGDVTVIGMTDAPIPWPYHRIGRGPWLIFCGDLVEAVRVESVLAVSHHWGVHDLVVWRWRSALGIGRFNEGTKRLFENQTEKLAHARACRKFSREDS